MGLDRVIHYDKPISKKVLGQVVYDYFGSLPEKIRWKDDRWYVDLPGTTSAALRSVHPDLPPMKAARAGSKYGEMLVLST